MGNNPNRIRREKEIKKTRCQLRNAYSSKLKQQIQRIEKQIIEQEALVKLSKEFFKKHTQQKHQLDTSLGQKILQKYDDLQDSSDREHQMIEQESSDIIMCKQLKTQIIQPDSLSDQEKQFQQNHQIHDLKTKIQTLDLNFLNCQICFLKYDCNLNKPRIICKNFHDCCLKCFYYLRMRDQLKCIICRTDLLHISLPIKLLQRFLSLTFQSPKVDNSLSKFCQYQRVNLTLDEVSLERSIVFNYKQITLIKFNNQYLDKLKAKKQNQSFLYFNEIIPEIGKYQFCIEIFKNYDQKYKTTIEIGIGPSLAKRSKNINAVQQYYRWTYYNPIDGLVLKPKSLESTIFQIKLEGNIIIKEKFKLILQVDMDRNLIRWKVDDQICAQALIANCIKFKKPILTIGMLNPKEKFIIGVNSW